MDIFMLEGKESLIKGVLTLLKLSEPHIIYKSFETCVKFLWQ